MADLPSLLSQALVAFTIEADNFAEHHMPHRTTDFGSTGKSAHEPWLTSMAMYLNSLKYLKPEGMTVAELQEAARTHGNLAGMRRWGYIKIEPYPEGKLAKAPSPSAMVTPTRAGLRAQKAWPKVIEGVEQQWRERFGEAEIDELRAVLIEIALYTSPELPDCMPILGYAYVTRTEILAKLEPLLEAPDNEWASEARLPILLAKVLTAFALDVEAESKISMAIGSNVLLGLGQEQVRVRDLPALSGVSKESIAMAITFLTGRGLAILSAVGKDNVLQLTKKGENVKLSYERSVERVLARWHSRFGGKVGRLQAALSALGEERLLEGTASYPDCWRGKAPRPTMLPHFPMVLHRGGYPDGS